VILSFGTAQQDARDDGEKGRTQMRWMYNKQYRPSSIPCPFGGGAWRREKTRLMTEMSFILCLFIYF